MTPIEVRLNHVGMRQMLSSRPVALACGLVAERIAAAVRAAHEMVVHEPGDIPIPVHVHIHSGGGRARARALVVLAHASGEAVEAKHRLLGRSVEAGRI